VAEELTKAAVLVEPTKIDTAASDSCTRSGTFALLLSLALISLLPYWLQEREEIALGRYLALRLNLASAIETLDDDSQWQQYKTSQEQAESISIEQLLKVRVEVPKREANTPKPQSTPSMTTEDKIPQDATSGLTKPAPPAAPNPPMNLRMSMAIGAIHQIAGLLKELNNSELLTSSRKASEFYNYSIYRWALKRTMVMKRTMLATQPNIVFIEDGGEL
jgi:hypothetical protein